MTSDEPSHDDRIERLEQQVEQLARRVETLEQQRGHHTTEAEAAPDSTGYDPTLNNRQRGIIDGIATRHGVGTTLGLSSLRTMVKAHSDVSNPDRVKQYIRTIAESQHFESAGAQAWTFRGRVDDE